MDEEGEYADGEIVWVKLSYCWWPGEVLAGERLTEEFLATLKRRPLAVVKFFDEDSYEYVKNTNFIYKYNCSRKNEFLRKGLEQYRAKNKHMVKFPADVMQAERATGGDPNIVNSNDFLPQKRESYADIFSPDKSRGKGKAGAAASSGVKKQQQPVSPSKIIPVIPVRKHEVRILGQASSPSGIANRNNSLTGLSSLSLNNSSLNSSSTSLGGLSSGGNASTVTTSPSQIYHCHKCGFESSRQNVIVVHTKYCVVQAAVPFNIPAVRESKGLQSSTAKIRVETPKAVPKPAPVVEEVPQQPDVEEELVEVIQVVQEKTGRGGRTPRAAKATSTPTPKSDRRKSRGRGKGAVAVETPEEEAESVAGDDNEKVELLMQVSEEPPVEEVPVPEVGKSLDDSTGKDSKGKADVELKNELLADWSEDEQDEQEVKEEKSPRKAASIEEELEKATVTENTATVLSVMDTSAEKSVESSPQLASPVSSSGTTIKYRNIPKKQKREFIEVTNDLPAATTASVTIEKSSSESSISTAATCGDKTASTSSADSLPEQRPISAKQRILDRATRGSSKSNSSTDEIKPEPSPPAVVPAAAAEESQPDVTSDDTTKNDIASCFDFKEEEEEEVVLSKSPRRSLSNRRDQSLDAKQQEQEELERAKKDAELKNEIDSLLSEVSVPTLPELPKLGSPRAVSPGPSAELVSPQSKEEIDRNRTLPPKERGKRIFKTRNKPIENEAIALEQSKAIVADFVSKSHEEERQQQEAEAKLTSESPTTTNDDSQESTASAEPAPAPAARFENSEFAAIKAKRSKLPPAEAFTETDKEPSPEESTVSSSNQEAVKSTPAEPESLPVSISKDQLTLEALEKTTPSPKSRKGKQKQQTVVSPIVLLEKLPEPVAEEVEEELPPPQPEVATPKVATARKKRAGEMDQLDLTALDTPRSRRGRVTKTEEAMPTPPATEEPPKENQRKAKRAKKEEEPVPMSPPPTAVIEEVPEPVKSKRGRQSVARSADSTADLQHGEAEPVAPAEEPAPIEKHQPIKMIIKSKGKKSNSELIYDSPAPTAVPEPKVEEMTEKLPKSPKSSKRKKEEPAVVEAVEPVVEETVEPIKSPKSKRPKVKPKETEVSVGPSAADLQVAEALIQLPEAPVVAPKVVAAVVDQEMVEVKSNNSSPVHSKSINPRKRHLQKLMDNVDELPEQPKPEENVTIPEKKKREMIEVVSVAPATIVHDQPAKSTNATAAAVPLDEDKFDIDNIPIVMDDSELLEDPTISTTSSNSSSKKPTEDDVKLSSTTKPMTNKIVIVKNSNGSAKIVGRKDPVVKKTSLTIKSTTITIKPPLDQLSPTGVTRSPTHSPTPMRSAQLVQASSGGQIVITSKGTVLTTQSPSTSSAKTDGVPKTHVTQSQSSKAAIVSSVVSSASSISSTSTAKLPEVPTTPQRTSGGIAAIKSPAKICVQSQEIIHPPTKPRPAVVTSPAVQKVTPEVHKKSLSASHKKSAGKKHQAEPGSSAGKPLFSTSKGDLITPQPATSSAVNPGKKNHRVIKISPQKLKEFTRLGMVEDKGKGKVLTASGMKKFRQEQEQLLQQQQQQQQLQQSKPTEKPIQRADSVDEEPSTSTPTPPPPSDVPAEVVVAAAADSSVKEPPVSPPEPEQSPDPTPEAVPQPEVIEENEAAAVEPEPECSSSSSSKVDDPVEATPAAVSPPEESTEPTPANEVPTEPSESGSGSVQESSQLIAVPAENFGGPANLFYLCSVREEGFVPVNNELLYLDSSNQLVALPEQASVEDIVQQAAAVAVADQADVVTAAAADGVAVEGGQQNILLNTQDGQQIILDQQSLMALAAAGGDTSQLLTPDGQQILLQGSAQELLAALAVSQPGLGIVAAEGTQIIVAPESLIDLQDAPLPGEIIQVNPNTTVETNAVLTKPPIMSTVEVPSKNGNGTADHKSAEKVLPVGPVAAATNLDESLAAVIGVPGNPNVPTSLELPITVTNPVIAKTTTSKINPIYQPTTAISAISGIDPAAAAAVAVAAAAGALDLPPAVAQTGTDSANVEHTTHESSSSDDKDEPRRSPAAANGKPEHATDDPPTDFDDDEIIPESPASQSRESQLNSHAEISSQFSDDDDDDSAAAAADGPPLPLPHVDDVDDNSNFSDVIPIQPNVILRNINHELIDANNENDNSSDMELDSGTAPGNQTADAATENITPNNNNNNNPDVER